MIPFYDNKISALNTLLAYQAGENKLNKDRCPKQRKIILVNSSISVLLPQVRDDKKQAGDKGGEDDNVINSCQQISGEDLKTTVENRRSRDDLTTKINKSKCLYVKV